MRKSFAALGAFFVFLGIAQAALGPHNIDALIRFAEQPLYEPNVLAADNVLQPILTVRQSNYGEITFRADILSIPLGLNDRQVVIPHQIGRRLSIRDGGSTDLRPIRMDGTSPNGGFVIPRSLDPGLYRYRVQIWLGSSSGLREPDKTLYTMFRVLNQEEPFGDIPYSFTGRIADVQNGLDGMVQYKISGGNFGTLRDQELTGYGIYLYNPSTGASYRMDALANRDPSGIILEPPIGVVTVPFEVTASPTLVITWYDFRSGVVLSDTILNNWEE